MLSLTRLRLGFALFFALFVAPSQVLASFNLMGGMSSNVGVGNFSSQSVLLSGEMTLNLFKIVEGGFFYDHNIASANSFNLLGIVARVGLGPISGLFVDAKAGVTPSTLGVGAGIGLGYRISENVGVRVGPRLITGVLGGQVIGDLGLMIYL